MVKGTLVDNAPWIPITIAKGQAVQNLHFILDTGFTGDLQVPETTAKELGLIVDSVTRSRIANGQVVVVPTALALASMEGVNRTVNVLISNSPPLAGISFFTKFRYTVTVDCLDRIVSLNS